MICASCGTWNREAARFCKHCGARMPAAAAPPSAPPPAITPRPPRPRAWWHGIGVFVIVAVFFLSVDLAATGHVTWSFVVVLSLAFLAGAWMILGVLASTERAERRPFQAGAVLLVAAVLLLPVAVALQSAPTVTETYTVPVRPGVSALDLRVTDDAGRVLVRFAPNVPFLAQANVTHIGGLFSSHYEGDFTYANATSGGTTTLTLAARATTTPFFLPGHDVVVTVNASAAVSMTLGSANGAVDVLVPAGVRLADYGIVAKVTTGNVAIAATNAEWAAGAHVEATSTTGGVTLDVVQTQGTGGSIAVAGSSTTGSVTFAFTRGVGIAARVLSTLSAGAVRFDATKYSGPSDRELYAPDPATFDASSMTFLVSLASTTGGITLG